MLAQALGCLLKSHLAFAPGAAPQCYALPGLAPACMRAPQSLHLRAFSPGPRQHTGLACTAARLSATFLARCSSLGSLAHCWTSSGDGVRLCIACNSAPRRLVSMPCVLKPLQTKKLTLLQGLAGLHQGCLAALGGHNLLLEASK